MTPDAATTGVLPGTSTHSDAIRLNNIAELRLLFAASVVLSHAATLLGDDRYRLLRVILNSEAAVQGFFVLSGYLVCGSYARIRAPVNFYRRRLLRIYPAYAAGIAIFIALALTQAMLQHAPVAWSQLPRYLLANLLTLNFLQPSIDGLFARNALSAVNGALWSIKVEIMFYAVLPALFALAQRWTFPAITAALIVGGILWWPLLQAAGEWLGHSPPLSLRFQLPGQIHFFGLGMALFATMSGMMSRTTLVACCTIAIALSSLFGSWDDGLHIAVLMGLIGGVSRLPQMYDVFAGQDISFGIYLSHFPMIQILLAGGAGTWPVAVYLATVCVGSIGYGLLSWNMIERPALALTARRKHTSS